jgi:hypothetical protein
MPLERCCTGMLLLLNRYASYTDTIPVLLHNAITDSGQHLLSVPTAQLLTYSYIHI